jgi:hypothetical protein
MNEKRREELIEMANALSNDDICFLINLVSRRCDVFIGTMGERQLSSEIVWACLNGMEIQINLETCEEDSIADLPWWRDAILEEAKRIRAEERAAKKRGEA